MNFFTRILGRYIRKTGIFSKINFHKKIRLNESFYKIPVMRGLNTSLLKIRPGFKTDLLEYISSKIKIDCFMDIGANIGQTMLEVYAWKKDIKYYGFEPSSTAFELLKELVRVNTLPAELFPCACSSDSRPIKLFSFSETDVCATMTPEFRPIYENMNGEWICSYSLDSLEKEINPTKNFVLKIDVEGAELKVLEGAKKTIGGLRPIIMCEVLHANSTSELSLSKKHKKNIELFLKKNDYSIYLCELSKDERYNLVKLRRIDNFPSLVYGDSPNTCDYLFLPTELEGSIIS